VNCHGCRSAPKAVLFLSTLNFFQYPCERARRWSSIWKARTSFSVGR
jgi:hypothetical protein